MAVGLFVHIVVLPSSTTSISVMSYTDQRLPLRSLISCLLCAGRCPATQWNTRKGLLVYLQDGGTCMECISQNCIAVAARSRRRQEAQQNHGQQAATEHNRTHEGIYRRLLPLRHPTAQHASNLCGAGRTPPRQWTVPLGRLFVVVRRYRPKIRRVFAANLATR